MKLRKFIAPGPVAAITTSAVIASCSLYSTYLAPDSYFRASRSCDFVAEVQTATDGETIHHVVDTLSLVAAYQERGGTPGKLRKTTYTERGELVEMTFDTFWICPKDY